METNLKNTLRLSGLMLLFTAIGSSFMMFISPPVDCKIEPHLVKKVYKRQPVTVIDQVSPTYIAVLENGDTLPVREEVRVNDTVYYKIVNLNDGDPN